MLNGDWLILAVILVLVTVGRLGGAAPAVHQPVSQPVVLFANSSGLDLVNRGDSELRLWGTALEGESAIMAIQPRLIPAGTSYIFFLDEVPPVVRARLGSDGKGLFGFTVFLARGSRHFVLRSYLLVEMQHGRMTVRTQNLGLVDGWVQPSWP